MDRVSSMLRLHHLVVDLFGIIAETTQNSLTAGSSRNGPSELIQVAIVLWLKEVPKYFYQQEADFLLTNRKL